MCTATSDQIYDIDIVKTVSISIEIQDARSIFEEVDESEFLSRPTNERFNIAHQPISDIDIVSLLHAYLRIFGAYFPPKFYFCYIKKRNYLTLNLIASNNLMAAGCFRYRKFPEKFVENLE